MKDIKITGEMLQQIIETNLPKMLSDSLVDKYDSPFKKAIDAAVQENSGSIKQFANEMVSTAVSDPDFKKRVGDAVIAKVLTASLSR